MKKVALFVVLFAGYNSASAQDGLFVRAQAGAGVSNVSGIEQRFGSAHMACDCGYDLGNQTTSTSVDLNTEIGYEYKRVRLITGLQDMTTGNLRGARSFAYPSGKTYYYPITDAYGSYNHLLVPISLSFKISLRGRSSLYPEIGTRIMFIADNDKMYGHTDIKGHFFTAKLNYEYALNKKLSLAITPAWYHIATPVFVTPKADYNRMISYNNVFMLQAGVVWHLKHVSNNPVSTEMKRDAKQKD